MKHQLVIQIFIMYIQDQSEKSFKQSKTEVYHLTTRLSTKSLQIHLKSIPKHKDYHRYSTTLTLDDLDCSMVQKFQTLQNLQAFLIDPNNIQVNIKSGIITLFISISLLNGKWLKTYLGQLHLKQHIFDAQKSLETIQKQCDETDIFSNSKIMKTTKQFVNMFKVLFKKVELIEEKLMQKSEVSPFKSKSGSKNWLSQWEQYETIKSENSLYELKQIPDNNKNYQLVERMKRIKEDLEKSFNEKTQQILAKQKAKSEMTLNKFESFERTISQQLKFVKERLSQLQNPNKFIWDNPIGGHKSINQIYSKQDELKPIQEELQIIRQSFDEFSNVVMSKFQTFGELNQRFQDKLKTVIRQLDIRLQEKKVQQSIQSIKTKIIDVEAPYFKSFQLRGTEIQYKGEDSFNTMLLGKLSLAQHNTFSIKLVKTLVNNVQIGIVDSLYRNQKDCWSLPNFVIYVGWNSTVYQGPSDIIQKQGQPVKEGDVITLKANIETGLIEWLVCGKVRTKVIWEKLKDRTIKWIPGIRFYDQGDIIQWVTEQMIGQ